MRAQGMLVTAKERREVTDPYFHDTFAPFVACRRI